MATPEATEATTRPVRAVAAWAGLGGAVVLVLLAMVVPQRDRVAGPRPLRRGDGDVAARCHRCTGSGTRDCWGRARSRHC